MVRAVPVVLALTLPTTSFAADILYCVDDVGGIDEMQAALDGTAHDVTVDTDIAVCDEDIATGRWDLVILAIQGDYHDTPNFVTYVDDGGLAILQDWSSDSTRLSAFGISGVAARNETSIDLYSTALAAGVSDPMTISNGGWSTFSLSVSVIRGTTVLGDFPSGNAVTLNVAGNALYNGFLVDSPSSKEGPRFYQNEIEMLLDGGARDEDDDGFTTAEGDCDDGDPSVNPAATEVCNYQDDDCDDRTDEGVTETFYEDNDDDGFGDPNLDIETCSATAGLSTNDRDCDDSNGDVNPDADEVCNGEDDDCNDDIDDDPTDGETFYVDDDGDGFGDPDEETTACEAADGYVDNDEDCDDSDDDVNPDADEEANEEDDDCDGKADENVDSDDDGLDDYDEREEYGTDPENADSDGDGIDDGDEVDDGTDPNDAEDPGTDDTGTTNKGLCGCTSTSTSSAAWLGLAALGIVIRARRRS